MMSFDFESHTPPIITEAELKRLAKARTLRRQALIVIIGACLIFTAMMVFCATVISLFPRWGALSLILPVYTVIWGGVIIFVFVLMEKRSGRDSRSVFFNQ